MARLGAPSLEDYSRAYAGAVHRGAPWPGDDEIRWCPVTPLWPRDRGKVLGASALAALARRRPASMAWFDTLPLDDLQGTHRVLPVRSARARPPGRAQQAEPDRPGGQGHNTYQPRQRRHSRLDQLNQLKANSAAHALNAL